MKVMKGYLAVCQSEHHLRMVPVIGCPLFNDVKGLREWMAEINPAMKEGLEKHHSIPLPEARAWWVADVYSRVVGEYD